MPVLRATEELDRSGAVVVDLVRDALAATVAARCRSTVVLGRVGFRCAADDDARLHALRDLVVTAPPPSAPRRWLDVTIVRAPALVTAAHVLATARRRAEGTALARGGYHEIATGRHGVVHRVRVPQAQAPWHFGHHAIAQRDDRIVIVTRDDRAPDPAQLSRLLQQSYLDACRDDGALILPAAGVARGDDGVVLFGDRDVGAVLALALLARAGWAYVDRERLAVEPARGRHELSSFPSIARLPRSILDATVVDATPRLLLERGIAVTAAATVRALVHVAFDPRCADYSLLRLPRASAAAWLRDRVGEAAGARALVEAVPSYRFVIGPGLRPEACSVGLGGALT